MNRLLVVFVLGVLLFTGCIAKEPEPPPAPAPPPEPSPEKIADDIRATITPMSSLVLSPGGAGPALTEDTKNQVINSLRTARAKYQVTENGRQALSVISHELDDVITKARDQERWALVLGAIEASEVLQPGTTKHNRLKERAQLNQKRPVVSVRGFFDDKETSDTYVFLDVKLRPSNEVRQVRARKGEEFFGVRLVDIVGNKKGVRLEYLAIPGDEWEVMGP